MATAQRAQKNFRGQKMKNAESSETRFPQVSQLYDLISGGKRPFKVSSKSIGTSNKNNAMRENTETVSRRDYESTKMKRPDVWTSGRQDV